VAGWARVRFLGWVRVAPLRQHVRAFGFAIKRNGVIGEVQPAPGLASWLCALVTNSASDCWGHLCLPAGLVSTSVLAPQSLRRSVLADPVRQGANGQLHGAQGAADAAGMRRILDVQSYDPPAIVKGHQEWPHYTDKAPVGLPIEKDAVRLQVPDF